MPRRVPTNADRVVHQNEVIQAAGRQRYRQGVGPDWNDSEEEGDLSQPSNQGRDRGINQYGEPLSPPPPYSEQDHSIGGNPIWSNDRVNLYPGEEGRADYVTDNLGRRERYVIDGFGRRVPWPFVDRENSSYNGVEDPDMIYLESGRVLPRNEWDAEHPVEYSSDGSVDDKGRDTSLSHGGSRPQTRRTRPRHWSSEDDDSDRETPRPRSGHRAGSRYSGRRSLRGRGGRFRHGIGEGTPHVEPRDRRHSDSDYNQEGFSAEGTDSERLSEDQVRNHRAWGSTGNTFERS